MILDAFERCIARYGLEGTALDQVAKEVGFRRGLVRHYLGNRDDMIEAMAKRAVARYHEQVDQMFAHLPIQTTCSGLLDMLFPQHSESNDVDLLVMEHLIAASRNTPLIRKLMSDWLHSFVEKLANYLNACREQANSTACWHVAYGIIGIYFNHESLAPLGLHQDYATGARAAVEALIESLSLE